MNAFLVAATVMLAAFVPILVVCVRGQPIDAVVALGSASVARSLRHRWLVRAHPGAVLNHVRDRAHVLRRRAAPAKRLCVT